MGLELAPSEESGAEAALELGADDALVAGAVRAIERDQVMGVLTAAGVENTSRDLVTTYDVGAGDLCEREFYAAVLKAGFTETRRASWPCESELADHGEVVFRDTAGGVFRLDDGSLINVHISHGWLVAQIAAPTRRAAADVADTFASSYPPLFRDQSNDGTVPITFWTNSKWGPTSRLRRIDASGWDTIDGNYTGAVRAELARLMSPEFKPGEDGQLLLWQGLPGTGKTWALRALASEWADWAEFNYITDPDAFFVSQPSYMIDVLLNDSYEVMDVDGDVLTESDPLGKWRVLILEDTGELLSASARETYAQGLSRLLNVVDGMVGQGLRVLAIVTTNDELGELHPAVTRPGRCASQIEFGPLSAYEAKVWLDANAGGDWNVKSEMTLAELYQAGGAAEAFADDMETCSDCGHEAMAHDGEDGACSMEDCSCTGFMRAEAAVEAALEEELVAAAPELAVTTTATASDVMTATNPATVRWTLKDLTFVDQSGSLHTITAGTETANEFAPVVAEDVVVQEAESTGGGGMRWVATLAPEGRPTDDGRIFAPGSITWRQLPLTLMGMVETQEGHDGAQVCGRIDEIWRDEATGDIRGTGEFDSGEFGTMIARLVGEGTLRGVSVDIAVAEMEIAERAAVLDEDGNWIGDGIGGSESEVDPIDALFGGDNLMFVVLSGVIGAATVCPFPAFADANIEVAASLVAAGAPNVWTVTSQAAWQVTSRLPVAVAPPVEGTPAAPPVEQGEALMASALGLAPLAPPAEWFEDPQLEELTPLTIDDEGRVFGHVAPWGVCHIGIPGVCTTAPTSETNYAYYLTKEVVCESGGRSTVGTITMDTAHAGRDLGRAAAAAHYDNTGTASADIVVGEDEFGIWCAGAVRPDLTEEHLRALRGASLSGDWREVNGNLELVGVLAVNVPGFPIPRLRAALVASGEGMKVTSLIAAGVIGRADTERGALTRAELRELELLRDQASGAYDELAAIANEAA